MKLEQMTAAQLTVRMDSIAARIDRWSTGDDLMDLFDSRPGLRRLGDLWATLNEARKGKYIEELFADF